AARGHASPSGCAASYGSMAASGASAAAAALVQYVVLRGDLARSWSLGAVLSRMSCLALCFPHGSCRHPAPPCPPPALTANFVSPQAPDEAALMALAETLKQHSIDHEVWTEQPEAIPTCLALRPYPKDQVHQHLKKFKLLK
ncbi:PTRD1 hydrolase, partial [Chauna torquata]|nr:PTRD1 hydrolase [Chauna torquata]